MIDEIAKNGSEIQLYTKALKYTIVKGKIVIFVPIDTSKMTVKDTLKGTKLNQLVSMHYSLGKKR